MKLLQVGPIGAERPGVLVDQHSYVDLSDVVARFDGDFFASDGPSGLEPLVEERLAAGRVGTLAGKRIGAPIARPHQILCIGLNYSDHAEETGQQIPDEPILFTKAPNTLVGPNDPVLIPPGSTKTDWEVELGVVIGKRARYLPSPDAARAVIAGYVAVNDVSEREYQLERAGQWTKGKSCETFNPCGPWLATADQIPHVQNLHMWLEVNGQRYQDGSTKTMVFDVTYLVYYLSQFLVLEPGDLINTGTPPGIGMAMNPPVYLRDGDEITLGIEELGVQRQPVRTAKHGTSVD